MNEGIQLLDSNVVLADGIAERGGGLAVSERVAAAVVAGAFGAAVAIDVHVCKLAFGALDVDDSQVFEVIAAVGECCGMLDLSMYGWEVIALVGGDFGNQRRDDKRAYSWVHPRRRPILLGGRSCIFHLASERCTSS